MCGCVTEQQIDQTKVQKHYFGQPPIFTLWVLHTQSLGYIIWKKVSKNAYLPIQLEWLEKTPYTKNKNSDFELFIQPYKM